MTATTELPREEAVTRRLFTADEVIHLAESGFFGDDERLELIEGEIVRMTPIGKRHAVAVTILNSLFAPLVVEGQVVASPQNAVYLDSLNLPQPDLCLVDRRVLSRIDHPSPGDTFLLIEVSDSTLRIDRGVKLSLYARSGIREYWILNLQDNVLEIHTDPDTEIGTYRQRRVAKKGESIAPIAFPNFAIAVSEVLL